MIKFKYPNTKVTEKQKKLLKNMKHLGVKDTSEINIESLSVKEASDIIGKNMKHFLELLDVWRKDNPDFYAEDGREFHEERGDV